MTKYISFGQFNKKYFYILGSLIVRIIITFIIGFTPSLTPGKTLYIFGFRSNLFSHPLITYCFQYFSLCLGGIILELIFRDKKKDENDENASRIETNTTFTFSFTKTKELNATSTNLIFNDKNKSKDLKYFLRIFLVYSLYYFAKLTMNSFDNIGFNRVKYWPFEFIFLYIFSKKILKKIFYTHQILSVSILILICTTISLINSFIPQSNEDCSKFSGVVYEECEMLNANVYKDINNKFGWYFIPIIILLYLVSMLSNAYSSITSKWLMDFKYITLNRILIYLGAIGLFYSLILLFIISHIPCSKNKYNFISYVCRITHRNDIFYDNYRTLGDIRNDKYLYIDIFAIMPIYIISSFLSILFDLLIIKDLDPFYLIPCDSTFFLIYEIIDYCLTSKLATLYRNLKFACQICSNSIDIFLCSIYLEIIELHFCYLDRHLKRFIIIREENEQQKLLQDINEPDEFIDSESNCLEDDKNQS